MPTSISCAQVSCHALSRALSSRLVSLARRRFPCALRRRLSCRFHPRRRHRCHRRQSHRRQPFLFVSNGKVVASAVSTADGSFQITTGAPGRFFLVVSAKSFRQLQTPDFYAGQFDSIERNAVLEPAWVRESIVVTATGTPTPQPQTSAATTVLGPLDLALRDDLSGVLRLMPGAFVVQDGQLGAQTSLFVRGGDSDDNKVLLDGVDVGDLGNQFNFGPLSTTAVESAEVYRGPDSSLYGAGADSSVISLTTPHGTTSFPSFLFQGSAGNLSTSREQLELAGAHQKLDYLGAFSWLQTANDLPNDEYHLATSSANVGWSLSGSTQLRATARYDVAGTGVPNAWDFYHVADDATEKTQDIFLSGAVDNQTTASLHSVIRYGLTRKREQDSLWSESGNQEPYLNYCFGPGSIGNIVTITGANGYSATGQAVLDCSTYAVQYVSNRDQIGYQGDLTITPHLFALAGYQYQDERGAEPGSTYYKPVKRNNYFVPLAVHGDFKNRFYYTLGGSLEHYSLFGFEASPRAGVNYYVLRPRTASSAARAFSSTSAKPSASPSSPIRTTRSTTSSPPTTHLPSSRSTSARSPRHPSAPTRAASSSPSSRSTSSSRPATSTTSSAARPSTSASTWFPRSRPISHPPSKRHSKQILQQNFAYELTINSEAFRAQGFETSVESGIGANLFLRGGYTYLDAVVQRSFTNDDEALLGPIPTYNGIPVGPYAPLEGARPFRRAPHTGYFSATYAAHRITGIFNAAFASRTDDSTYLDGEDVYTANADGLLLPNRNLDYGYAKLDIGGSFQLRDWVDIFAQADNLTNNRHIAPIGYPSLPFTARAGLRIRWGPGSGR